MNNVRTKLWQKMASVSDVYSWAGQSMSLLCLFFLLNPPLGGCKLNSFLLPPPSAALCGHNGFFFLSTRPPLSESFWLRAGRPLWSFSSLFFCWILSQLLRPASLIGRIFTPCPVLNLSSLLTEEPPSYFSFNFTFRVQSSALNPIFHSKLRHSNYNSRKLPIEVEM